MTTAPPDGHLDDAPAAGSARPLAPFLVLGGLVVVAAAWRFTPLAALLDRRALADLACGIASSPAAPALVVAAFVAGGLVFCPITPLFAATALVFDPARALLFGVAGALASAALAHLAGQVLGRRRIEWLERPRPARLRERLRARGVLAITAVRLVPAGNFTLTNIVAGAIGIRFRDFMLGNVFGLVPSVLVLIAVTRGLLHLGSR